MAGDRETNPYLTGNFGPWRMEGDAPDLEVEGRIPEELSGTYFRNGPNPAYPPGGRYHWFDGDGMIHAIRLEGGRAHYRNRWVQSRGLAEERNAGRALYPGILDLSPTEAPRFKNTANTNIVAHAGRLLALVESSLPTQMDFRTLATRGEVDFDGRLTTPMTAHPKMDPTSGEMLFFGYSPFPPYLTYHVVDRTGALVRSEPIELAWPSMIHDFAITADAVVFILCPIVFSFENLARRGSVFTWEPERGTRLGVMPRSGGNADVRWFECDPCYVFHPMNAYRDDERIVLDVARYGRLHFMSPDGARATRNDDSGRARLTRWTIDLAAGAVRSTTLDEVPGEFPRVDERVVGRRHRFGYQATRAPGQQDGYLAQFGAIRRYDLDRGQIVERVFAPGSGAGEPIFVPRRAGAAEDEGYVMTLVYDATRGASDFFILDARDIAGAPVAVVRLPHRVPYGFHGNWVPSAEQGP